MHKIHIDKTLMALLCMLPILLGFLFIHGPYLSSRTFFVPWQHDDFEAFWGFHGFDFWTTRPTYINLARLAGSLGEPTYYVLYVAVWFLALVATQFFIMRVLELRVGLLANLAFAGVGSLIWYSLPASVLNLQYIGLITNSLSYFLGVIAGLLALRCVDLTFFSREHLIALRLFAVFVLLAAFAKEDMAPFLGLTAIYSSYLMFRKDRDAAKALLHFLFLFGVIAISFAASIVHSIAIKSPIFSNTGVYDLSGFTQNIVRNISVYLQLSRGSTILISGFAIAAVFVTALSWRDKTLRPLALSLMFLIACAFALMAPYLILPRIFDYYAMNFIPILAFSVAPTTFIAMKRNLGEKRLVYWGTALAMSTVVFAIFLMDTNQRSEAFDWIAGPRDRSARQLEVLRAMHPALGECRSVNVTGVSGEYGPFLEVSAKYLNRKIGRPLEWRITVLPGTILGTWSESRRFPRDWVYVNQIGTPPASECNLDFDPETLRATLHRPGLPDIAWPTIAEATQPLEIKALGPDPVQVGQPFNVQLSGASAIWVHASRNVTWGSRIRLGESILNTQIQGDLATAEVPISLIQRVENLPVSLVGPGGELRSNVASLSVVEAGVSSKITEADTQPLEIKALGPNPVQVGKPFDVQPSGASAIWVRAARNIPTDSRIRLGESILITTIQGALATAEVPISIIQRVEDLPVSLVGPRGESRSNVASLKVVEVGASSKITETNTQPLEIKAFGPNPVQVGQPFNVQPSGASAIWVRAAGNIPAGSRIRLGESILVTTIQGALATAEVPISIIQRVEDLPVSLVGPGGELRSKVAILNVSKGCSEVSPSWISKAVASIFSTTRTATCLR